jgi:hypothetical protein
MNTWRLFYSFTQPSIMDLFNGAIAGIVLYVIWFVNRKIEE